MSATQDYSDYYRKQLEEAWQFQDYVCRKLHAEGIVLQSMQSQGEQLLGENLFGLEIKHDKRWRDTGNLYIETHEKSHPANLEYVTSGILRQDNSWLFGIGDREKFFIFAKSFLILCHERAMPWVRRTTTQTSKGLLLPLDRAELYAAKVCIWS